MSGTMSKYLQRDLANLQRDLMTLASSVEEAIHKAIKSLETRHHDLAQQVIDGDRQIDEDENHVEEECLKMLALHQPVAVDLRRITAALKINAELERMGDLAEDIAERAIHLSPQTPRLHAALARTYALSGKQKQALSILHKLEDLTKTRYVSPFEFVAIHFALGHVDLGFDWLTKACQDRSFELISIKVDPRFDSLKSDRRFVSVARQMGLE